MVRKLALVVSSLAAMAASAADSKDVNVVNTPSVQVSNTAPIAVADPGNPLRFTTSLAVFLAAGKLEASATGVTPACPAGTQYLVNSAYAVPDFTRGGTRVAELPQWAVNIPVYQASQFGSTKIPITLIGQGFQSPSVTLPAGQWAEFGVVAELWLVGGTPATFDTLFYVHVSGYCGQPVLGTFSQSQ